MKKSGKIMQTNLDSDLLTEQSLRFLLEHGIWLVTPKRGS